MENLSTMYKTTFLWSNLSPTLQGERSDLYDLCEVHRAKTVQGHAKEDDRREAIYQSILASNPLPDTATDYEKAQYKWMQSAMLLEKIEDEDYKKAYEEAFQDQANKDFAPEACADALLRSYYQDTIQVQLKSTGIYQLDATDPYGALVNQIDASYEQQFSEAAKPWMEESKLYREQNIEYLKLTYKRSGDIGKIEKLKLRFQQNRL